MDERDSHRVRRTEAGEFLRRFKALIGYNPGQVSWVARADRMEELEQLQLTQKLAEEVIRNDLTDDHCVRGPEPDDNCPDRGEICIFRCPLPDRGPAYIKLALRQTRHGQERALIYSFKPA